MFVSAVQPVAMRRAVFWTVCSLFMLVLDMRGDQTVLAYSRMGLVIALYVATRVSFFLPQDVEVNAFRMFMDLLAVVYVFLECSLKVSLGSKVTPRTLGCLTFGMG